MVVGDFAVDGTLVGVSGFLVDVTEAVRRTTAREVDEAMELMSHSRPAIDQAKGALMVTYGLDPDEAFLLLRRYSQQVNVKVRDVARNIVEALPRRRPSRRVARHLGRHRVGDSGGPAWSSSPAPDGPSDVCVRADPLDERLGLLPVRPDLVEQRGAVDDRLEAVGLPERHDLCRSRSMRGWSASYPRGVVFRVSPPSSQPCPAILFRMRRSRAPVLSSATASRNAVSCAVSAW